MAQAADSGYSGMVTSADWGGGQLSTSDETDAARGGGGATPPPGYGGSPRGGRALGEAIAGLVQATASRWSIDQVLCDPGSNRAVIEWTVRRAGALARGAEWYEFDPGTGLITEIRAYLASPPAAGVSRLELEGFPYAERGYTMDS
jgi:hypothetical protein